MVIYSIVQYLGQSYSLDLVRAYVRSLRWDAGSWLGTMGSAAYGCDVRGWTASGAYELGINEEDPAYWIVERLYAGAADFEHSFLVWRMSRWQGAHYLTGREIEALRARLAFLQAEIDAVELARRLKPGGVFRDITAIVEEAALLREQLRPAGSIYVLTYIGFAAHVGPHLYLLPPRITPA